MNSPRSNSTGASLTPFDTILAGNDVDKDRLIRDVTIEFLEGVRFIKVERDELVNELFLHVRSWIRLVNELHERRLKYQNLTPEQIALIVIMRHDAMTVPTMEIPDSWEHQDGPAHRTFADGRILGVRIYPAMNVQPNAVLVDSKNHHTSPSTIDALVRYYRPGISRQHVGRVRNLVRQWAPRPPFNHSDTSPEEV